MRDSSSQVCILAVVFSYKRVSLSIAYQRLLPTEASEPLCPATGVRQRGSHMATTAGNGAETVNPGPSIEDRQSAVSNVQSQIDTLADLCKRLQTLRQLPGGVLRSDLVSGPNQVLQTLPLKDIFGKSSDDLRILHAAAVEGKVQDALRAAAESEQRDGNNIRDSRERESQKRRCVHQALGLFVFTVFLLFPPPPGRVCSVGRMRS